MGCGKARPGLAGHGLVMFGKAGEAWLGLAWHSGVEQGVVRNGRLGQAGCGWARHGAVGHGQAGRGRAGLVWWGGVWSGMVRSSGVW